MWNLDVSLAEGTVMACSAPALPFPVSFRGGCSHWVECSLPVSCLSFLQRELALWTMPSLPVGKVLRRQMLCFWHHLQKLSQFSEKNPPLPSSCEGTWCLSLADRLPWPSHFILTLEETAQSPAVCRQDPRLLSSLPACLSFPLFLRIWPTKAFTNDSYSEARANKRLEKKNPLNVWFAFSVNLLSCQGHFDWLLASLVNSQITQAASISFSQFDKSVSSITPTLIVQF